MILVDTSVWIDHFRERTSPEVDYLSSAILEDEDLCTCGIVRTEVLQGIQSDEEYRSVKSTFDALIFLPMSVAAYTLAADIYRGARSKGQTIRNTIDCLIAACAIMHNTPLLQNDRDYLIISQFSRLKLVQPA